MGCVWGREHRLDVGHVAEHADHHLRRRPPPPAAAAALALASRWRRAGPVLVPGWSGECGEWGEIGGRGHGYKRGGLRR